MLSRCTSLAASPIPGSSTRALGAALALALVATIAAPPAAAAPLDEVPHGTVLSAGNSELGRGALPDEILDFYRRGEYASPILHLSVVGKAVVDPRLVEASKRNRGTYDVNDEGTVIDPATGKRPPVIIGRPFPEIDPNDPKAGSKVVWNWFYTLYWDGAYHTNSLVNWISRDGPLRRVSVEVHFKYYDGNPPEFQERIPANPLNLLSRTLSRANQPVDLNGIASLNWRYRDGDKSDNAWSYVPALRRVRPVNPANRSDGFLGSDISQDDGPYFDGKPEDFHFRLIGEGTTLAGFDRPALEMGAPPIRRIEPGEEISTLVTSSSTGWKVTPPEYRVIAAQEPGWKKGEGLVAWAPTKMALVARPVWILEVTPKNPYYLYGKQIMYFDKESYRGYWKNKYDWQGHALNNFMSSAVPVRQVDGPPGYMRVAGGGNIAYAINYKLDRATVTGMPAAPNDHYIEIDDSIYEIDRVIRAGK